MSKSKIEWTDETWNPTTGCTKVSQGCKNCYAERLWPRLAANPKHVAYGRPFTDVRCHPERLQQPLHWKRTRLVFVDSMSDLFHEAVPFDFIFRVLNIMARASQHTFQVLTKRPENMKRIINAWLAFQDGRESPAGTFKMPHNIWLGVSVEDQGTADERIPILLDTPASMRFISAEPLLGHVDLGDIESPAPWDGTDALAGERWMRFKLPHEYGRPTIDWVICGGESGPKARPMHPDWARSLRDQCFSAGVPFFFKQWGEWSPIDPDDDDFPSGEFHENPHEFIRGCMCSEGTQQMYLLGKKTAGRLLDGREHLEYPA